MRLSSFGLLLLLTGCAAAPPPSDPEPAPLAPAPMPPAPVVAAVPVTTAQAVTPPPLDVSLSIVEVPLSDDPTRVDVARVVETKRALEPVVRTCAPDPSTAGEAWLAVRVDDKGALGAVQVGSSDLPEPVATCLRASLGKISLGAQPTPLALSVVVKLSPGHEQVATPPAPARASAGAAAAAPPDMQQLTMNGNVSTGDDPMSARGNLWGDEIGDSFGVGGLGMTGTGSGGGGRGEGIGLGSIGTLGHGAGTGTGQGYGTGHGRLGGAHRKKPPSIRMGATSVSGRLPPEVIQRIVRQNFGRFRLCYENALKSNPSLQGRVTVSFTIDHDGSVSSASREPSSSLPDAKMIACVTKTFSTLSFPEPEGGRVKVVYPVMFSPGDDAKANGAAKPKPLRIGGKALASLTSGDLSSALAAAVDRTSLLTKPLRVVSITRDDQAGSPFVVLVLTSSGVVAIERAHGTAAEEARLGDEDDVQMAEIVDLGKTPLTLRAFAKRRAIADDLLEAIADR